MEDTTDNILVKNSNTTISLKGVIREVSKLPPSLYVFISFVVFIIILAVICIQKNKQKDQIIKNSDIGPDGEITQRIQQRQQGLFNRLLEGSNRQEIDNVRSRTRSSINQLKID